MSYHSNPTYFTKAPPKKLQIVLVNAIHNNKAYLLEVSYWLTVIELKAKIEKVFAVPVNQQRLFYQSQELLQNNFSLSTFGGRKKIKLILRPTPNLENTLGLVKKYETLPRSEALESLLSSTQEGFNLGLVPKLTFNGTSGSYFLRNKYRKTIGVFKPFDEEPFAPNNPKEYKGTLGMQGFRKGILSGESAIREVSAYLLDEKEFSSVPVTTFVEIIHPYFSNRDMKEIEITEIKENPMIPVQNFFQYDRDKKLLVKHGSLQKFIEDAEEASDFSSRLFPDSEVRKIAILDLRIMNCDRNEGNILVKKEKGELKLTPIDHGLSFPDCFDACTYDVVWMEWGHVKKKWTPAEISYIKRIDPKGDVDKLSKHFKFRDICLRNFRIAETVLKKGALAGLTLFEIGSIMYKEDPDLPSPIEELVTKTEEFYETVVSTMPKEVFLKLAQTDKKNEEKKRRSFEEEEFKEDIDGEDEKMNSSIIFEHLNLTSENIHNLIKPEPAPVKEQPQSQNKLFVIPEIETHHHHHRPSHTRDPTHAPGLLPKRQSTLHRDNSIKVSSEIDSSKGGTTDRDSSDDDRNHTDEDNLKPGKLRRSNSIPAAARRKNSSDTEIKQNGNDDDDDDDDASSEKQKCKPLFDPKRNLGNKIKKRKIAPQNDEIFFRYFECFLDQEIEIMTKAKQAQQPNRGRFKSEVCSNKYH